MVHENKRTPGGLIFILLLTFEKTARILWNADCGMRKVVKGYLRKIPCGMKGKVWNETMWNVAEMNIY